MKSDEMRISNEELEQAIGRFRQSVKGWSEAKYAGVHTKSGARQASAAWKSWWMAAGAAATTVAVCALAAVMLISGHRTEPREMSGVAAVVKQPAKIPTAQIPASQVADDTKTDEIAQQKRQLVQGTDMAANVDAEDADAKLLAGIDSDIAQGVPKALAPMANWMGDSAEQ